MEDDIDIEEHDVLDNPHIRNILGPEITQIKTEIPDDDYYEPDQEQEYQPHLVEDYSEESFQHSPHENQSEYARYGNKIILGRKPNVNSRLEITEEVQNGESVLVFGRKAIKTEVEEEQEDEEETAVLHYEEDSNEAIEQVSNVVILGSKPSTSKLQPLEANKIAQQVLNDVSSKINFLGKEVNLDVDNNEDNNENVEITPKDPTKAFVSLEDWGPRLDGSSCYCKECQILFPTCNTLLAHNNTAHSFLVAVDKNKAVKSTAKNIAPIKTDSSKFCNHCNKMFPDPDSLINHLYEKLTFDKSKPVFKYQPKKVISNPISAQSNVIVKEQPFEEAEISSEGLFYRCKVCSCFFKTTKSFSNHMKYKHLMSSFSIPPKEAFNAVCVHCNKRYARQRISFNKHIRRRHPNIFRWQANKSSTMKASVKTEKLFKKSVTAGKDANCAYRCLLCQKTFSTYFQARHHRNTAHPEHANKNIFTKILSHKNTAESIQVLPSIQNFTKEQRWVFVCNICGEIHTKYNQIKFVNHRKEKHPNFQGRYIFKKVFTSDVNKAAEVLATKPTPKHLRVNPKIDLKLKAQYNKPSTSQSGRQHFTLVPKSVLFKCDKCDLHFTSSTAAVLHSKFCANAQNGEWRCTICELEFKNFDQDVHTCQHQISEDFEVVVCFENMHGRILNQCPDCNMYLHENSFYKHVQNGLCSQANVKCGQCTFRIHASSIQEHLKWHTRIETNKDNVILVEFSKIAVTKSAATKRNLSLEAQETPTKKVKVDVLSPKQGILVKICKNCGCSLFGRRNDGCHMENKCNKKTVLPCHICGLSYNSSSHIVYHKTYPKLTLKDLTFVSLQDNNVIAPPIPNLPNCTKCKVHFCKMSAVNTHCCQDSYKTCKQCQKKFSDLAYKMHMRFHEYHNNMEKEIPQPLAVPKVKNAEVTEDLPILLKQYEKLTNTWNVLFLCSTCDIVFDSYDKTVEHCQKHFNNMESYDMIIEQCKRCDLKLDSHCFKRHLTLHAQNESVSKDSFTILPFDFTRLLQANWVEQFQTLPPNQIDQILFSSIYNYGRSIKLRVVQNGPPDTTIYKCGKCTSFIQPNSLASHNNTCRKTAVKFPCRYCEIVFCAVTERDNHEKSHIEGQSLFKIVYFNEDGDDEFNETLKRNDAIRCEYPFEEKQTEKKELYEYYRCVECKTCVSDLRRKDTHNCKPPKFKVRCDICLLIFHKVVILKHKKKHERYPDLIRKNIRIIPYTPKAKETKIVNVKQNPRIIVKLFKCECGLHFTSSKAIEKHFESCSTDTNIAKENCSKCGYLFDTTQLVTHLCKHHSNGTDAKTKFVIENVPRDDHSKIFNKDSLYKCHKCDVYYLSNGGLEYHYKTKHKLSKIKICKYCKLKFMPQTLIKHIQMHHADNMARKACSNNIAKDFHDVKIIRSNRTVVAKTETQHVTSTETKKFTTAALTTSKSELRKMFEGNIDLKLYSESLYKCNLCLDHFMTLKALHSHIQRQHRNKIRFRISKSGKCDECGYSFNLNSLLKHRYIHHQTMKLKRGDLKIIVSKKRGKINKNISEKASYSERKTGNEDGYETIDSIDDSDNLDQTSNNTDVDIKLDKPVHVKSKIVKSKTIKSKLSKKFEGKIDHKVYSKTLHRCTMCNNYFLTRRSLHSHTKTAHRTIRSRPPTSIKCGECGYSFIEQSLLKHRYIHHQVMKLKRGDFRVLVSMTGRRSKKRIAKEVESDDESNMDDEDGYETIESIDESDNVNQTLNTIDNGDIKLYKTEHVTDKIETVSKDETDTYKYHNVLFKCDKCDVCFLNSNDSHVTGCYTGHDLQNIVDCSCGLRFSNITYTRHQQIHHKKQNLTRNDLYVVNMKLYDQNVVGTDHLFRCGKCDLNYFDLNTLLQHLDLVEHRKKSGCAQCGLVFSTSGYNRHELLHHKILKFDVDDYVVMIAEGGVLKVLNPNKKSTNLINIEVDPKDKQSEKSSDSANDEETGVQNYDKNLVKDTSKGNINSSEYTKVYQCGGCKLCFFTLASVNKHIFHTTRSGTKWLTLRAKPRPGKKCTQCPLIFSRPSMVRHMRIHHDSDFNFESLTVVHCKNDNCSIGSRKSKNTDETEFAENISTVDPDLYTNKLFKCSTCSIHFMVEKSLDFHVMQRKRVVKATCTICKLAFSVSTLPTHIHVHHESMKLANDAFSITSKEEIIDLDFEEDSNNQIENDIEFLDESVFSEANQECSSVEDKVECSSSNTKDMPLEQNPLSIHTMETDDVEISELSKNKTDELRSLSETNLPSTSSSTVTKDADDIVKLYKCAECNVCFLTQTACYRHVTKHISLHPKDYIECKLCGYQFLILNNVLHKHVTKHHNKDFKAENVLIEEYNPNVLCHGTPKINIYFGNDKVQSKQVSTTSEANANSLLEEKTVKSSENSNSDLDKSFDSVICIDVDSSEDILGI